jgi:hypothetical protein
VSPAVDVGGLDGGERREDEEGRVSVYEPEEPPDLDLVGDDGLELYP